MAKSKKKEKKKKGKEENVSKKATQKNVSTKKNAENTSKKNKAQETPAQKGGDRKKFTDDGFPTDPVSADDVKRISERIAKDAKKEKQDTDSPPDIAHERHPSDLPKKEEPKEESMTLMDHLNELRRCLTKACIAVLVCFTGTWVVVDPIFNALVDPLLNVLPAGSHAMYTTLPEGFFTRMFIAFVVGLFVASPVIFYQIWSFIAPGLYDEEKRYIVPIAFLSALFFIGGGLFCFFIVFPFVFTFFISFATESIVAMPKVSDYLDFVLKLLIAFGLIFEMPLFAFFLSRLGIVTAKSMRSFRKYAVLLIFIVAAILTPPDVVSQLLMAGPMILLYELSILIAALFGKEKRKENKTNKKTA